MPSSAVASRPAAKSSSLRVENQLCFMLYATSRAITATYRQVLDEMGLTYPQYLVMLVLWEKETSPLSVGSIGEKLLLDFGTLTPLLKRMEGQGLIVRKRDAVDERQVMISLTKAGKDLKHLATTVPEALLCKLPFPLSTAAELRRKLKILLDALSAQPGKHPHGKE